MLQLDQTTTFKKCLKKYHHKKTVLRELEEVIDLLVKEEPIPAKYLDHELQGKHKGIRELHLKPDDLLMYVKIEQEKYPEEEDEWNEEGKRLNTSGSSFWSPATKKARENNADYQAPDFTL